jgi:CRISPR/Cas system CMR-associated protein Cmr3 (group 5 of RAMP superfamily)
LDFGPLNALISKYKGLKPGIYKKRFSRNGFTFALKSKNDACTVSNGVQISGIELYRLKRICFHALYLTESGLRKRGIRGLFTG